MSCLAQPSGSGSIQDLSRLLRAEGAAYPRLRTETLQKTPGPWDVAQASQESWELGILAFALNARLRDSDTFARWDENAYRGRADILGWIYRFRGGSTADAVAFLLEAGVKPPQGVRQEYPMSELLGRLQHSSVYAGIGHPALWRVIWQDCSFKWLREASLFFLASGGDPDALDIVAEVLRDQQTADAKQLKVRCFSGLVYSESEQAKDLVIEEWDRLKADSLHTYAIGVLSTSSNPRAREILYGLALDTTESETSRRDAIEALSTRPHVGDKAFLGKFFSEVESVRLERKVLTYIWKWFPLELRARNEIT